MQDNGVNDVVMYGLDQFLPQEQIQKDVLERVDLVMQKAVESGNPEIAFKSMKSLLGVTQVGGLAFAKFVYVMGYQWEKFNQRDTFESQAVTQFGRGKKAIKDNFKVWEMLVSGDIPREYCDKFKLFPIRCLIPIASLWKQGWEVEPHQWMRLSQAPDPSTIGKIIREIKKVEPKKGSLQITMEEDGSLIAWKNDQRYFVGHLNVQDDDEVIQQAIERIMGDGRIMTKESNL